MNAFSFKEPRVFVGRPAKPARVIMLARRISALIRAGNQRGASKLLDETVERCGPYTFVGFAATDGKTLLDVDGKACGMFMAGDVFFPEKESYRITGVPAGVVRSEFLN
jgi:hypothetical protein